MTPALAAAATSKAAETPTATLLGLSVDNWSTIATGVFAALVAASVAVVGYARQQRAARQAQRTTVYAQALQAVEDYMEGPYRIRRRDGSAATRQLLTESLSDVKSRINFHQSWLSLHASKDLADAYTAFVQAAQREAGAQMTSAWRAAPTRKDRDVPLGVPYKRQASDLAKGEVLDLMRRDLDG